VALTCHQNHIAFFAQAYGSFNRLLAIEYCEHIGCDSILQALICNVGSIFVTWIIDVSMTWLLKRAQILPIIGRFVLSRIATCTNYGDNFVGLRAQCFERG
jgi:hypothetical protein